MWLNDQHLTEAAIRARRETLATACPRHIVIDHLFDEVKLDQVLRLLQQPQGWLTQQHTYEALYVDSAEWQSAGSEQRFVQRDAWQRDSAVPCADHRQGENIADEFLSFLRGDDFFALLSQTFGVTITDINVAAPSINSNFFRLGADDFVGQHADDSPGREVRMLLYLNKGWRSDNGGELVFSGADDQPVRIAPLYNRCVLFDPSSKGSEHWVERLNAEYSDQYRYNVTSWYWSQ
jgi:Rps23 Pro-64 3,4-dihydroxylase Tpa1-like proline 4-hydroxylase